MVGDVSERKVDGPHESERGDQAGYRRGGVAAELSSAGLTGAATGSAANGLHEAQLGGKSLVFSAEGEGMRAVRTGEVLVAVVDGDSSLPQREAQVRVTTSRRSPG
jgi:hypothetical protein